jgi:hypothetical protein
MKEQSFLGDPSNPKIALSILKSVQIGWFINLVFLVEYLHEMLGVLLIEWWLASWRLGKGTLCFGRRQNSVECHSLFHQRRKLEDRKQLNELA